MTKWTEELLEEAISEVYAGSSCRAVARRYFMNESVLRYRMKMQNLGLPIGKVGRKPVFSQEDERELANCIRSLCSIGFSPAKAEVLEFASAFVRKHQLTTPFKDGRPGKVWLRKFLARNNLSVKKAAVISSARKSATSNPFVIYNFYDKLENLVKEKNLGTQQIWNCDETSFCTDPRAMRVVSVPGEPAHKITSGAGRENASVLAACNAAGVALDPMVIFKGKNFQSTWKGTNPLPSTLYGVSDNGWMTGEVFLGWFQQFVKLVPARPLLLIFDGHITHLSIDVIELAVSENITLLKLPPHVTDLLQPLDVACFSSLKKRWEELLANWISVWGPRKPMTKSSFVNHIGSIWRSGLSESNIISGFARTGIFPLDRSKYPRKRLDPRLVKRYEEWVAAGRPESDKSVFAESEPDAKTTNSAPKEKTAPQRNISISTPCKRGPELENSAIPPPAVPGKKWIRSWVLIDGKPSPIRDSERSFEEIIIEKVKAPSNNPAKKRRKIDLMAKVITEKEYADAVKAKNKKVRRKIFPRNQDFSDKKNDESSDESDSSGIESEEISPTVRLCDNDGHSERLVGNGIVVDDITARLVETWGRISHSNEENDVVNSWYGAIFSDGKKSTLYVGRVVRRFLADFGGPVTSLELDCLKPNVGSANVFDPVPSHQPRDIGIFDIHDIIAGPLEVTPYQGNRWIIPTYNDVRVIFQHVRSKDRKKIFQDVN